MNEKIEAILAEKVKSCFSTRQLPESFADSLISSYRRRMRNFRLKICGVICILIIALTWAIIPVKHNEDKQVNNEAQLISASESKPSQEITGLMILGLLRDCILPRRNNKKREESSNGN